MKHTRIAQDYAEVEQKRVALFNVKYSPNLGDGMIAESIEAALTADDGGIAVTSFDLAGRKSWGDVSTRNRRAKLAVLKALPPGARRNVTALGLKRSLGQLHDIWHAAISEADHVIIGGGHLFQDDGMNFPLKVGAVLDLCRQTGARVSVHGVGVSAVWSDAARDQFLQLAECNVGRLSVRDQRSFDCWAKHFAGTSAAEPDIVPDPALTLVAPESGPESASGRSIGLAIADPTVLAYHGDGSTRQLQTFFAQTARLLVERGHDLTLFTNGAQEDENTVDRVLKSRILARLAEQGRIRRAPKPGKPEDVVALVNSLDCVIAHRLHANILAYALGRPTVGLGWDEKVESFFRQVQRTQAFVPKERLDPDAVVTLAEQAQSEGLNLDVHRDMVEAARDSLSNLRQTVLAG